jgi:putative solute:sodium symporter small subunit
MQDNRSPNLKKYWKANKRLIYFLLAIWALVSIGFGILLVEPLNSIQFFGVPLGFWFAQQGSIYVFVILIFVYAWRMDRLDHDYHADE